LFHSKLRTSVLILLSAAVMVERKMSSSKLAAGIPDCILSPHAATAYHLHNVNSIFSPASFRAYVQGSHCLGPVTWDMLKKPVALTLPTLFPNVAPTSDRLLFACVVCMDAGLSTTGFALSSPTALQSVASCTSPQRAISCSCRCADPGSPTTTTEVLGCFPVDGSSAVCSGTGNCVGCLARCANATDIATAFASCL
jgi:hypothetical protein